MSQLRASAEKQLVDAVKKSRDVPRGKRGPGAVKGVNGDEASLLDNKGPPPLPPPMKLAPGDEEKASVLTLEQSKYDPSRAFPGLARQKIEKKERHTKAVDNWTRLLDEIAEKVEQDLLQLSRDMNERLAQIDDDELAAAYKQLQDSSFLVPRSEDDLFQVLDQLKGVVARRSRVIEDFAKDLDGIETKRAEVVGIELKLLVDRLIAIAHQLPDEIEHIVESETFDLNSVLTTNRKAHAQLLGLLRKTQIEVEVEALQRWENGRKLWRQLRHDRALAGFGDDITNQRFTNPEDRRQLLLGFREQQTTWKSLRQTTMERFAAITSESIQSSNIVELQRHFASVAEDEMAAISECYKSLGDLRAHLKMLAEDRVEALRKELHTYGALKDEPLLRQVSIIMQQALEDESLQELWRLGGGIKSDFQSLSADVVSVDVCYERLVSSVQERLELICCGFSLKGILEERGRLMQLDKVRNLITKLRGVPKTEVPGVITALIPELEDVLQMEQVHSLFKKTVSDCIAEMNADMERVSLQAASGSVVGGGEGNTTAKKSAASSRQTGKSTAGGGRKGAAPVVVIDPTLVKSWSRRLGILYFGSDLPPESRQACFDGISMVIEQRECNRLVDIVVSNSSDKILKRMDAEYSKLNDSIVTFLETQSSYVSLCMTNVGEFFLLIAKLVEEHRKEQRTLDEKSADELFDLSEDFRIEREDREVLFEQACQVLRASTTIEELHGNFEKVLELLEQIQASYRTYHGKACFAADKYPLVLVDEFRRYLLKAGSMFSMNPSKDHPILGMYTSIFDETMRLNKKFFDADPKAGGVEPRPTTPAKVGEILESEAASEGSAPTDAEQKEQPTSDSDLPQQEIFSSPLLSAAQGSEPALAGSFRVETPLEKFSMRLTLEKEAPGEERADAGGDLPATTYKPPTHPNFPWIRAGYPLPLSEDELAALDDFDRLEFQNSTAKSFVPLDETVFAALSEESQTTYKRFEEMSDEAKARIAIESESSYIRSHVPADSKGDAWVLFVDVDIADLSRVVGGIRDSLVTTVEKESARRIARAQAVAIDKKADFTEELEDRLRTHWPRRGRVETGIKQPRETELLSHEEKTWRHIQNIQQRMIDLQKKFNFRLEEAKKSCDDCVNDLTALRNSLSNSKFRNLAALQGVDMKARAVSISFQSTCAANVTALRKLTTEDVAIVVSFAMEFRKICPPQAPGVEGGYSEAEILEIEALVVGQCEEAKKVAGEEWLRLIDQLIEQQEQSLLSYGEFTKRYEKCAQDLAMSEGLGQKYGAPRRRAQERIRTEISRDEQAAGKIDELLAKLEFVCEEHKRKSTLTGDSDDSAAEEKTGSDGAVDDNGRKQLDETNEIWSTLATLRASLQTRAEYLKVVEVPVSSGTELPWLTPNRIPALQREEDLTAGDLGESSIDDGAASAAAKKQMCLDDVFVEVDAACRKETRELYESEGMGSVLGEGGVPESLQAWLLEAKEKLLGPRGHRIKAWKRLWGQTTRLEQILGRKPTDGDGEGGDDDAAAADNNGGNSVLSAPAVCMQLLTSAFTTYAAFERCTQEKQFMKLVRIWEKGREKHERLLRPRLGSPDAADELAQLDATEQARSKEFTESVIKFQGQLIRSLVELTIGFCEEIGVGCKGLVHYVDSSMRLDALKLPPDTAIPKKRMTMKRLRKAQRIKDAVGQGAPDLSRERIWPALPFETQTMPVVLTAETLVPDLTIPEPASPAAAEAPKKGAPPKKGEPAAPAPTEAPTLVSRSWKDQLAASTVVKGTVTTAHRIVIKERDRALAVYTKQLDAAVEEVRHKYKELLTQEASWIERWGRQVASLKGGL